LQTNQLEAANQTIAKNQKLDQEYEVLVHWDLSNTSKVVINIIFKENYDNKGETFTYDLVHINNVGYLGYTNTYYNTGSSLGFQISNFEVGSNNSIGGNNYAMLDYERISVFNLSSALSTSQIEQILGKGNYANSSYNSGPQPQITGNVPYGLKFNLDGKESVYADNGNLTIQGDKLYLKSGGYKINVPTTKPQTNEILKVSNVSGSDITLNWSADNTSDSRLKKDIVNSSLGLDKLIKMRPITFKWNNNAIFKNDKTQIGLIAQEVEQIIPEIVGTDSRNYKYIEYNQITSVMIKAIQELKEKNDELVTKITELENKINSN